MIKTFKIYCKEFNFVALLYDMDMEEEAEAYEKLKEKVESSKSSFLVRNYVEYLLSVVLVDGEEILKSLKESQEDMESSEAYDFSIRALYDQVLERYPHFCLEAICSDINASVTGDEVKFIMNQLAKELHKESTKQRTSAHQHEKQKIKTLQDINKTEKYLKSKVIGQQDAIETVVNALKLIAAELIEFTSLFFIGPTGVGKTKLAKELATRYSNNFFKINCAEYTGKHEYSKLIGAPPGYIGYSETSLLAEKAEQSNRWVFLFDEIEKADEKLYDFLLSLLDEGTCTDNMGAVLDFSKSVFVFTSNQGMRDSRLGEKRLGFDKEVITYTKSKDHILSSLKKEFNPEFLNRIDRVVFFNEIDEVSAKKIARLELKNLPVKRTAALLSYIVKKAYSIEYGARNIEKFIKNDISLMLADHILSSPAKKLGKSGQLFVPKFVKGELHFDIEPKKEIKKWDASAE
jgi:ATP-dependent Clp protease ATP-binding subunit ClpA